jgi:hypothetical protein
MKTVISLCDLTGNMTQPWVESGYNAVLVDPQHAGNEGTEMGHNRGYVRRLAGTGATSSSSGSSPETHAGPTGSGNGSCGG